MKDLTKTIEVVRWPEGAEDSEKLTVVLRKWSTLKLITLLGVIKEIGQLVGDDFSLSREYKPAQIASMIHDVGEQAVRRSAELVAQSVLRPPGTKAADVLEWDIDDFMAALTAIIEMNLADGTRKNFAGLRDAFAGAVRSARAEAVPTAPTTNSRSKEPSAV